MFNIYLQVLFPTEWRVSRLVTHRWADTSVSSNCDFLGKSFTIRTLSERAKGASLPRIASTRFRVHMVSKSPLESNFGF